MSARTAEVVLVDSAGRLLGEIGPFELATPWWQDLVPLIEQAPDIVVLRLLEAEPAPPFTSAGGRVRYLAESRTGGSRDSLRRAIASSSDDEPLRMRWAKVGGPAADLAWAEEHVMLAGAPLQIRSWNLSSIWRLPCSPLKGPLGPGSPLRGPLGPTTDGAVWLKCVPPFMRHESFVLRYLAHRSVAPTVLADDGQGGRMLLADLPGEDGYGASAEEHGAIIETLVALQADATPDTDELVAAGVPDCRSQPLRDRSEALIARRRPDDEPLAELLASWDERMAQIAACGIPDTLVHGDMHPGNARVGCPTPLIFDWGDSCVGHPLLDTARLLGIADPTAREQLLARWLGAWERAVPGSDPYGAWELLRPIAILRSAVVFQHFLDNIEPAERAYHVHDVDPYLDAAAGAN